MKSRVYIAATCLLTCLLAQSALAFDENRKGFTLGLGLGGGYGSYSVSSRTREGLGFGTDFKIGHGINRQTMIYYSNRVLWYEAGGYNRNRVNGMSGVGVTHFTKRTAPSPFFCATFGLAGVATENYNKIGSGPGLTLGLGYEVRRGLTAELTVNGALLGGRGYSGSGIGGEPKAVTILLTLNWLAY